MPLCTRVRQLAVGLNRLLDVLSTAVGWLVLPLALLLFLQWPLRDWVGQFSRQANDAAQAVFALYVALAIRQATRHRLHMASGRTTSEQARGWLDRHGEAILVLPWAVFVLIAGAAPTWRSLVGLEAFPDTFSPLYFVVRCSAWLLALGVFLQAVVALVPADPGS